MKYKQKQKNAYIEAGSAEEISRFVSGGWPKVSGMISQATDIVWLQSISPLMIYSTIRTDTKKNQTTLACCVLGPGIFYPIKADAIRTQENVCDTPTSWYMRP